MGEGLVVDWFDEVGTGAIGKVAKWWIPLHKSDPMQGRNSDIYGVRYSLLGWGWRWRLPRKLAGALAFVWVCME